MQLRQKTVPGSWTRTAETVFMKFSFCPWQNICAVSADLSLYLLPDAETIGTQSIKYSGGCIPKCSVAMQDMYSCMSLYFRL